MSELNLAPQCPKRAGRPPQKSSKRGADGVARAIAGLDTPAFRRLRSAAADVVECRRILGKTGHNVVGELLAGAGQFLQWAHYPEGDAHDPESHAQYYYHAHPQSASRPFAEHGHFHLFLRRSGMPRTAQPEPDQSPVTGDGSELAHLFAISMNEYGDATRIFTTNRWVTGDTWYTAEHIVAMLDRFDMDVARPNWLVNRWVTAMAHLFRLQVIDLLRERDARLKSWSKAHRGADIFEDRRLEIISSIEIRVDRQIAAVAAAGRSLGRRNFRINAAAGRR